jgi:hypothetical protein
MLPQVPKSLHLSQYTCVVQRIFNINGAILRIARAKHTSPEDPSSPHIWTHPCYLLIRTTDGVDYRRKSSSSGSSSSLEPDLRQQATEDSISFLRITTELLYLTHKLEQGKISNYLNEIKCRKDQCWIVDPKLFLSDPDPRIRNPENVLRVNTYFVKQVENQQILHNFKLSYKISLNLLIKYHRPVQSYLDTQNCF